MVNVYGGFFYKRNAMHMVNASQKPMDYNFEMKENKIGGMIRLILLRLGGRIVGVYCLRQKVSGRDKAKRDCILS
jgi:hypothetical protein